jgi:hypothetical protein
MCRRNSEIKSENTDEINTHNDIVTSIIMPEIINSVPSITIDDNTIELLGFRNTRLQIENSNENKFIGYVDFNTINSELLIGDIFVYEKYIVIEYLQPSGGRWSSIGWNVYEFNENLKITEYKNLGIKLYERDYGSFIGIYDNLIFVDIGSDPGIRGIEIFDIVDNISVLLANYIDRVTFRDNVVGGLIFTEWHSRNPDIGDKLKNTYFDYMEGTPKPDESFSSTIEFIMHYSQNLITHEIIFQSGEYIHVQ